ncbi:MAG: o-succinylbenzoate synthase [Chlorobi bacterium]|nr:o-succinylbenzoate synthase [Chlorobiota bacterium]
MIVKDFRYFPFTSKLPSPLITTKGVFSKKKGFIVSMTNEEEKTFFGEAAPLPPFSEETIGEIEAGLKVAREKILAKSILLDRKSIEELLDDDISNSVRFAVESILIQFASKKKNETDLFNGLTFSESVNVNAVASGDNLADTVKALLRQGFNAIKIKIGTKDFEEELRIIQNIEETSEGKIQLRLDVNGKWSLTEAKEYLPRLGGFNIQYIEEPVSGMNALLELAECSPIPIAIDESLSNYDDAFELLENKHLKYFVIKPARFGGLIKLFDFIKAANNANKFIVISSSLETSVGKGVLAFAASAVAHDLAHGLGIVSEIDGLNIEDPLPVKQAKISLENFPATFEDLRNR